jgi:hypothetical protein
MSRPAPRDAVSVWTKRCIMAAGQATTPVLRDSGVGLESSRTV